MGNPFRRIEFPASTTLQVIEAHRLFHLVTAIVHGKAMHCRSNCRAMLYYAYCAIISQLYVILCLLSYGAHFGLLCLLCHNKPTVCHTMPTRVPCYAYNVTLKLQHLLWYTMLTNIILCLFSITSLLYVIICLLRCNAIPTIIYYAAVSTVGYCAIISQLCLLCHSKLQCLL